MQRINADEAELLAQYNASNHLLPNDASAEKFGVAVHDEMPSARELIQEFQKVTDVAERKAIIDQASQDPNMAPRPVVLVGVGCSTPVSTPLMSKYC